MKNMMVKIIKNTLYEAGKGGIIVGGAAVNFIDAEPYTIAYLIFAGIIFNIIKEMVTTKTK